MPKNWVSFPDPADWKEAKFHEILNVTKGIAVHSLRVVNYLAQRTNTTNNLRKYKIIRACSNLKPRRINMFTHRKIDILFFEKYADLNRSKEGEKLLSLLKGTNYSIVSIKYGSYNKKNIKKLANDSKYIIYFSFYDTGAIGLKEIQNFGVFTFCHQKDLVINNETCFYIPELAYKNEMRSAFTKIIKIIKTISTNNPNSKLILKIIKYILSQYFF